MPPLFTPSLRPGHVAAPGLSSSAWLSPAQRVVRVLQVTRANWPVAPSGRRKKRRALGDGPGGGSSML